MAKGSQVFNGHPGRGDKGYVRNLRQMGGDKWVDVVFQTSISTVHDPEVARAILYEASARSSSPTIDGYLNNIRRRYIPGFAATKAKEPGTGIFCPKCEQDDQAFEAGDYICEACRYG